MFDESVSSSPTFWATLYSWFTPTIFFLLLQLVIATIYITSTLSNAFHKHQPHQQQDPHQNQNFLHQQQLYRSPSVLQRLKSINFYSYPYRSQDVDVATHTPLHTTHSSPSLIFSTHTPSQQEQQQFSSSNDFTTHNPPQHQQFSSSHDFTTHNPPQHQQFSSSHDFTTHTPPQHQQFSTSHDFATHTPPQHQQLSSSHDFPTHTPPQHQQFSTSHDFATHTPPQHQQLSSSHDFPTHTPPQQQDQIFSSQDFTTHTPPQQKQLARSPSVLERLKSINFYSYFPTEPLTNVFSNEKRHVAPPQKQKQKQKQEEEEEEVPELEDDDVLGDSKFSSLDEVFRKLQGQGGNFTRTHSDTKPESGEVPVKLSKKMKKSASSKSAFGHFKEEDIVESRRPATARESKVLASNGGDDDEVDAKADDFINKFKQQLKLQRIDSIMRYKDMVTKGTEK